MRIRKLTLAVCALLLGACSPAVGPGEIPPVTPKLPNALKVGDCLVGTEMAASFDVIPVTSCKNPHDGEVVHIFNATGETFDSEAMSTTADQVCGDAVVAYIGPNWENLTIDGLDLRWFKPSKTQWDLGQRQIVCFASAKSGQPDLTVSLKGKG